MRRVLALLILCAGAAVAAPTVQPTVIFDAAADHDAALVEAIQLAAEQVALGDYSVAAPTVMHADGTVAGLKKALAEADAAAGVDVVIMLGPVGALVAQSTPRTRPTVALSGIMADALPAPVTNLALGVTGSIRDGIDALAQFGSIERVAVVAQADLEAQLAPLMANTPGVEMVFRGISAGKTADLQGVDAVWIGPISGVGAGLRQALFVEIVNRKLRTWAADPAVLREGGLFGPSGAISATQKARAAAFAIQKAARKRPVQEVFDLRPAQRRVAMNMSTAKAMDFEPPLRQLSGVRLINATAPAEGEALALRQAVEQALLNNLQAQASNIGVRIAQTNVREARGALLPSLRASIDAQANALLGSDSIPSDPTYTLDAGLTLTQLIFAEQAWAGFDSAKLSARAENKANAGVLLDVVLQSANAWLGVARAKAQFVVQQRFLEFSRENLALAEGRIKAGQAAHGDIARWESQLASDEAATVDAGVGITVSRLSMAATLGRGNEEGVDIAEFELSALRSLAMDERLWAALGQQETTRRLEQFLVNKGLETDPELARLRLLKAAQARQLKASRRSLFLPQINLQAGVNQPLWDKQPPPAFEGIPNQRDGTAVFAGVTVSLPLFEGLARYARIDRAEYEVARLNTSIALQAQTVEQRIRTSLRRTAGAFIRVQLDQRAAKAAARSLEQVQSSYGQGAVGVTNLIETQQALQGAEAAVINSTFGYLTTLMEMSRSVNAFYFLLAAEERSSWGRDLGAALARKESK